MKGKSPLPKAALGVLREAFNLVGERFGAQAKCVEAAAILYGVAKHLGYDLEVRPVSVGVNDLISARSAIIGKKIQESLTEAQLQNMMCGYIPDDENHGHVVLTLDDPASLMDPNLRQLNPAGINVPNVFCAIDTADPENGQWDFSTNKFDVTYLLDDGACLGRFWIISRSTWLSKMTTPKL